MKLKIALLLAILSPFTFAGDIKLSEAEMTCLAKNIYFEARNQSRHGKIAVGLVTLNRVADKRWPSTVCGVVYQAKKLNGKIIRNKCQFSWYCDGLADDIRDWSAYHDSVAHAKEAIKYYNHNLDFTYSSTHYHTTNVNPWWNIHYKYVTTIDDHKFYK